MLGDAFEIGFKGNVVFLYILEDGALLVTACVLHRRLLDFTKSTGTPVGLEFFFSAC